LTREPCQDVSANPALTLRAINSRLPGPGFHPASLPVSPEKGIIVKPDIHPDVARNLALVILASSTAPALLLDGDLAVIAGSTSFYAAFALEPLNVAGRPMFK